MNNILGKILILFTLFFLPNIYATNLASYTLTSTDNTPYVKEAVKLTFVAKQKEHSHVMFFFLKPKESQDYKIVLLNKNEEDLKYHDKQTTFTYLLFPLKPGVIHVDFDYTIKIASDDAIAEVYTGGRDNTKWIETTDAILKVKPLELHVKKLQKEVSLVGDFNLTSTLQSDKITAYESANVSYFLQGNGYDDINILFIDKIPHVEIFSNLLKHNNSPTQNGFKIERKYNYALVSDKNITIDSYSIECFSPRLQEYYTLKSKAYNIEVIPADTSLLLDKEESPKMQDSFSFVKEYALYLLIFLSGFITAKILPKHFNLLGDSKKHQEIQEAKTAKALLNLLLSNYNIVSLKEEIELLEAMLYHNEKHNFKKIKQSVLTKLKSQK